MTDEPDTLTSSVAAVACAVPTAAAVQSLPDGALLAASTAIATVRDQLDARAGWVAAEIARRSRRELGYGGLAQSQGFRTAEALVQNLTGSTRADAVTMVRVGTMIADTAAADALAAEALAAETATPGDGTTGPDPIGETVGPDPVGVDGTAADPADGRGPSPVVDPYWWRAGIARAVTTGGISYAQAEAIRAGLGEPGPTVTGEVLADAAVVLIDAATNPGVPLTVDELRRLARQLRDSVDAAGLLQTEKTQQDAQYVKAWKRADGMIGGALLLDRENGAYFLSIIDELTSPRRGGPRFVDPADKIRAQQLVDDPRTTERIAADGIMQLLRIGATADPNTIYSTRKPAVRIIVTADTLTDQNTNDNRGVIQDTGESISVTSIERNICDTGTITTTIDSCGTPLDVGREQRLFTTRQKIALAIRDGGCMIGGCDRPASWTEAHHINHWHEHHGHTDTRDGILLCRYHHLALHNNKWRILRH